MASTTRKANKANPGKGSDNAKLAAAKQLLTPTLTPTFGGATQTNIAGYSLCNVCKWCGSQGWHATYVGAMLAYIGATPKRSTIAAQVGSGRASVTGGTTHHGEPGELAGNVGDALRVAYAHVAALPIGDVQALYASLPASTPRGKRMAMQPYASLAAPASTASPANPATPKRSSKAK